MPSVCRLFDLLTEHTAANPITAGEMELFRESGSKMVFKLLLADTWHADVASVIGASRAATTRM